MPAKEIKELRQAGKLEEAYAMAKAEMQSEPENIWSKRNMSWVIYSQLDAATNNLPFFLDKLEELKQMALPESEEMFFENLSIVIAKAVRNITGETTININKVHQLFDAIKNIPLKRNSKWFSVLYKAFHKGLKESYRYIEFADWWNFENFKPEDYQKEKLPNGKDIMSLVEQAYIAYAKHLLPNNSQPGEVVFDISKAEEFLPKLIKISEDHPTYQYPAYFHAKLLLALGDKENMLSALLPFAKKKRNDFWVWEILAEAFSDNADKVFACYCKALSCNSPEEMLVNLRQKMAGKLIAKNQFNEAKTEIQLLVKSRTSNEFKIPNEVANWQLQDWYKTALAKKSNIEYYHLFTPEADALLYSDTSEEKIIVDFVNADKKMLNFIASDTKFGYFKYDRFLKEVKVGDILNVRLHSGTPGAIYQVYTAVKVEDDQFRNQFFKEVNGEVRIPEGRAFGFLGDAFVHPSVITKLKLVDGMPLKGNAIKTYNQEKKVWSWKVFNF